MKIHVLRPTPSCGRKEVPIKSQLWASPPFLTLSHASRMHTSGQVPPLLTNSLWTMYPLPAEVPRRLPLPRGLLRAHGSQPHAVGVQAPWGARGQPRGCPARQSQLSRHPTASLGCPAGSQASCPWCFPRRGLGSTSPRAMQ